MKDPKSIKLQSLIVLETGYYTKVPITPHVPV